MHLHAITVNVYAAMAMYYTIRVQNDSNETTHYGNPERNEGKLKKKRGRNRFETIESERCALCYQKERLLV